jgi:hypothetical protein
MWAYLLEQYSEEIDEGIFSYNMLKAYAIWSGM